MAYKMSNDNIHLLAALLCRDAAAYIENHQAEYHEWKAAQGKSDDETTAAA
ncbi:MAG: hypothetical protein LKJ90_00680 [Faecalibacterium sp.]|jgi:hypothetical protein|nr:hypothetical protein [Faecalibacterium sp.]